jgi:hypothetical protein
MKLLKPSWPAGYKKPEDLIGEDGLLKQLAKLLVESPGCRTWPGRLAAASEI